MNLILEKTNRVKFFTNMVDIFSALKISCVDYDWFISDIETNGYSIEEGWHTGRSLEDFITENSVQFIWAVFCAFPVGTQFPAEQVPFVEDNPDYWNHSNPEPQIDGALFEIACWDSSGTIFISLPESLESNLRKAFPEVTPLR